jgi:hypothetical protein
MKPINIQPTPVEHHNVFETAEVPTEEAQKVSQADTSRRPRPLWRAPLAADVVLSVLLGKGGRLSLVDRIEHLPGIVQQRLWRRMRDSL